MRRKSKKTGVAVRMQGVEATMDRENAFGQDLKCESRGVWGKEKSSSRSVEKKII